jgi:hypothetical protein
MEAKAICIGKADDFGGGIRCFSLMKEFTWWINRPFNSAEEFMIWSELTFEGKQMYADVMNRPTQ